jgi:hypothetical protein
MGLRTGLERRIDKTTKQMFKNIVASMPAPHQRILIALQEAGFTTAAYAETREDLMAQGLTADEATSAVEKSIDIAAGAAADYLGAHLTEVMARHRRNARYGAFRTP